MGVPPRGVGDLGKFLLPPPPLQSNSFFFFSRIVCWNLSLGKLDFCKFSFMHGYLPRAARSRFFPDCAERGLGRFAGSPFPQSIPRSVCLLLNATGTRLLPDSLAYGARSHNTHRGPYVRGWISISLFKRGGYKGELSYTTMMQTLLLGSTSNGLA